MIFNSKTKIYLIACSNQLPISYKANLNKIVYLLKKFNLNVVVSKNIFRNSEFLSNGRTRGAELNTVFKDKSITHIFDVSGGDLCNEILPYIDFDIIKESTAIYFGYSDLSVLLNAIYKKSDKHSFYYNIKTILSPQGLENFYNTFLNKNSKFSLFSSWNYEWLLGDSMTGIILGGNVRCTLKLAGTEYIPSFKNNILFLESNGGDINKIRSFLAQYNMLEVLENISGLIIGEFTEITLKGQYNDLEKLCIDICTKHDVPLIKTNEIGHNIESKGIVIGKYYDIKK